MLASIDLIRAIALEGTKTFHEEPLFFRTYGEMFQKVWVGTADLESIIAVAFDRLSSPDSDLEISADELQDEVDEIITPILREYAQAQRDLEIADVQRGLEMAS